MSNNQPPIKNSPNEPSPAAKPNPAAKPAPAATPAAAAAPALPAGMVSLSIDGRSVIVPKGTLIVDAAAELGIEIPVFCSHPKLDPVACCRMCLVEVTGPRGPMLQTACSVPVAQDMVVRTDTEQVVATQEANLAFILLNHPLDCPICDKGGECPLQDQTLRYGPGISQMVEAKRRKKKHYAISDTIVLDQERCVVCWRCIRYLEEWEDKPQLGLFERGGETIIDIQPGKPVDAKSSGNIIDLCPVGALTNRTARFAYRPWEIERTPSICIHCSMGCNLRMDSRTHSVRRHVGRENMAVNDQWICDKGRFANGWINDEARLLAPMVRKNGTLVTVTWGEALQTVADRLNAIRQSSGPDAIGFIGSPKLSNESNYLLQRLARQIVGTNNIDHRDGGDVAALPTGLPALADLMKPQYGPDPKVDVVMLVGVDPSEELPILDVHLKRAIRRGKLQVIVVHPRAIELTRYKGPFLQLRPGAEVTLLNALTRVALPLVERRPAAAAAIGALVADATDARLRDVAGVDAAEIKRAAELLAKAKSPLIVYGPQVARGAAGQAVAAALGNLALAVNAADKLAYVGLDANSQGARDMGVLPGYLPGHRPVSDEGARKIVERAWGGAVPARPGKSFTQMLGEAGGAIKALYLMGANPAAERSQWDAALGKVDFLVVQDLFLTESAQHADVVLPAVSWAECDGTFTNLERRVQRAPKAVRDPNSKAAADWMILDHLAARFGFSWPFADEKAVTTEISKVTPQYAGLTWEALGDQGVQWDAKLARQPLKPRRAEQPALPAAATGSAAGTDFALVGSSVLYDAGTLFSKTETMRNMAHGDVLGMHPTDAARMGLAEGDLLAVRSDAGQAILAVRYDATVLPGTLWIPESLPSAAAGALQSGAGVTRLQVAPAAEPVAAD